MAEVGTHQLHLRLAQPCLGFFYGNPRNWPFDHWIQQSPNVVIVSVYYRLDAFGFLSAPSFTSTNTPSSIGTHNAGLLDQREALRWVQKHISAFGGDPARVTINGESAGGASVVFHLVSRGAAQERLFSGAIAQSIYRTPVPLPKQQKVWCQVRHHPTRRRQLTDLQRLFDTIANATGCSAPTEAAAVACLRKASVGDIARAQDAASIDTYVHVCDCFFYSDGNLFARSNPYGTAHPVLDGQDLVEYPTQSFLHGTFKDVPLIVG